MIELYDVKTRTTKTDNKQTLEEIVKSDPFLKGDDVHLDLSGFPALQNAPVEKFEPHDKNGFNNVDVSGLSGLNGLKEFLESPDRESLERAAKETGDPELIERIKDEREEAEAKKFMQANPGYYRTDENSDVLLNYLEERSLPITAANLSTAFRELTSSGELEVRPGTSKQLTNREELHVAQVAATGDVLGAATLCIRYRLGEDVADQIAFSLADPFEFTSDPQYRPILEESVLFAWEHYRKDYSPTRERRAYLKQYAAGRFLNVALLDAAWESCKIAERDATRVGLLGQVENRQQARSAQPVDLDSLSDDEIADLRRRTLWEYAKQQRRGAGVLQ